MVTGALFMQTHLNIICVCLDLCIWLWIYLRGNPVNFLTHQILTTYKHTTLSFLIYLKWYSLYRAHRDIKTNSNRINILYLIFFPGVKRR